MVCAQCLRCAGKRCRLSKPERGDQYKAIVAGTTRRKGKKRGIIYPIAQGYKNYVFLQRGNNIAILFGREDRGLFNEEVEECGFLLSIPANTGIPLLTSRRRSLLWHMSFHAPNIEKPTASCPRVCPTRPSRGTCIVVYGESRKR